MFSAQFVLQFIQTFAGLLIIVFILHYFFKYHAREKKLEEKENKIDSDYHHVVDTALAKERKILDDATREANQIITGAQYINQASRQAADQALQQMVSDIQKDASDTAKSVDQALQKMVTDVHKEVLETTHEFMSSYQTSLEKLANKSLTDFQDVSKDTEGELQKTLKDFQDITKGLEGDLQKQMKEFHETLLPALRKELDEYKQNRMKEAEQTTKQVIQKASQEILNKSISLSDHEKLVIDSLEKARSQGAFE